MQIVSQNEDLTNWTATFYYTANDMMQTVQNSENRTFAKIVAVAENNKIYRLESTEVCFNAPFDFDGDSYQNAITKDSVVVNFDDLADRYKVFSSYICDTKFDIYTVKTIYSLKINNIVEMTKNVVANYYTVPNIVWADHEANEIDFLQKFLDKMFY